MSQPNSETRPRFRWVVVRDFINDVQPGYIGRGNFPVEIAIQLPYEFQILDADGEVYFTGRCDNPAGFDESQAFQPLDAFEGCGCTDMRIRAGTDHKWETL